MEKEANEIIKEIKQVDNSLMDVIVPMLKDTITDYRQMVFKLIAVIAFLIFGLILISGYSIYKYNDFLSQFEYESEDTVFQDLDTTDESNLTVNSGINFNK